MRAKQPQCARCGKPYELTRPNKRFCSEACQRAETGRLPKQGARYPAGPRRDNRVRAVIDVETSPFKYSRVPEAFAAEYLDANGVKIQTWGRECIYELLTQIIELPSALIYMHNGGRFDFSYFREWLENPVKVFGGAIVRARIGRHEVQDSLRIIPQSLKGSAGGKDEIDYKLFERGRRERHKAKILKYLHRDCVSLLAWVQGFEERFGYRLSVGGAAIAELQKFHPQEWINEGTDSCFREYYLGGRVEVFEAGDLRPSRQGAAFRCYDVRSMYPYVMKSRAHPVGDSGFHFIEGALPSPPDRWKGCYFADIDATSAGSLPVLSEDGARELSFPHGRRKFKACGHEIEMALKLGLLEIHAVAHSWVPKETQSFGAFVEHWYAEKRACRERGDIDGELFAKHILNSAYGKFGQNPDNFAESLIVRSELERADAADRNYELKQEGDFYELWQRPLSQPWTVLEDVSIAASITSAARAVLLEGLHRARRAIYCDTDSIICEDLPAGSEAIEAGELGEWDIKKFQGRSVFDRVIVAGKKTYGLGWRPAGERRWRWEIKSKGARVSGLGLVKMLRGEAVLYRREAPTFGLGLTAKPFIVRRIRATAIKDARNAP